MYNEQNKWGDSQKVFLKLSELISGKMLSETLFYVKEIIISLKMAWQITDLLTNPDLASVIKLAKVEN